MHIDPLVVVLGAALCLIPILFGILIANWRSPWIAPKSKEERDAEAAFQRTYDRVTEMVLRDEGDVLAADPPHENCDCSSCVFWREWHR